MPTHVKHQALSLALLSLIGLISSTINANIAYIAKGENKEKSQKIILAGLSIPSNDIESIKQAILLTVYAQKNPTAAWLVEHSAFHNYLTPTERNASPLREQLFPHFSYTYQDLPGLVARVATRIVQNCTTPRVVNYEIVGISRSYASVCPLALFLAATENLPLDITRFDTATEYFQLNALLHGLATFPSKNPADIVRMMQFDEEVFTAKENSFDSILEKPLDTDDVVERFLKPLYKDNPEFTKFIEEKQKTLDDRFYNLDTKMHNLASALNISLKTPLYEFIYAWMTELRSEFAEKYNDIPNKAAMQPLKEIVLNFAHEFATIFNGKVDFDLFLEIINRSNSHGLDTSPIVVVAGLEHILELEKMLNLAGYDFDQDNMFEETNTWTI
jgi:hypothetical protein